MQSPGCRAIEELGTVADDELLRRVAVLLTGSRRTEADLVAHLGEVDARRLYAREATPSMFVYCTERLHLSEAEACLRIAAARASRAHPGCLEMLADGRLHLSAIARLAPHLTAENRDDLLRRATHRTKREIDELVAELAPRADVPACIRKLPAGRLVPRTVPNALAGVPADGTPLPAASCSPQRAAAPLPSDLLRPERVDSDGSSDADARGSALAAESATLPREQAVETRAAPPGGELRLDLGHPWVPARRHPATVEPLSPARYKVEFTASSELRDKLVRLQDLMRSSVPSRDLGAIIEAAVSEMLERLEARRFGRTSSPRKTVAASDTAPRTRHVPAAVKRAVHERDEGRCRYVDAQGRRCTGRAGIEVHHRRPWALGGDHSPGNLSLLCRTHNRFLAEGDFGERAVGEHRRVMRALMGRSPAANAAVQQDPIGD